MTSRTAFYLRQLVFFLIAAAMMPIAFLKEWYLRSHLIIPCPIEKLLAQTCEYDNALASFLAQSEPILSFWRHIVVDNAIKISAWLFAPYEAVRIMSTYVIIIAIWMLAMNSMCVVVIKLWRLYRQVKKA